MWPIVKFGLAKDGISSTLHTVVRYGPWSLGGIGLFDPFVIQGVGQISFLIEHYWKSTPSSPILWANLSTLQLEAGRRGRILENDYIETQQWIQTESWILKVCKFMSTNQTNISNLGLEVSTQLTNDTCRMTHLELEVDFTTSELRP